MMPETTQTVTIDRLGARGDGIADTSTGPLYVPYALPGERVRVSPPAADPSVGRAARSSMGRADARTTLIDIEIASPEREIPVCPLFTRCGGCTTQHISEGSYRTWKRNSVVKALEHAGIEVPVDELIDAHGTGRRRVTFHARRRPTESGPQNAIGFMVARSHELIPIEHCPVLDPALSSAPRIALAFANLLLPKGKPLDIQITATLSGLDVDIRGHGPASEKQRHTLIQEAIKLEVGRLSIHGDLIIERYPPGITMGSAIVTPPAGGFLQATALGEQTLAHLVLEACNDAPQRIKRAADLFAGCGPFALRLAEFSEVHAVESASSALTALDRAFKSTRGLRQITTEVRDLFRRPLLPLELNRYDAVIFDPPRAGAQAQAQELAKSKVPLVIAVSCDAGTFARDAKILLEGGYVLKRVTPIDQFRYSPHVETVGVFVRQKTDKLKR